METTVQCQECGETWLVTDDEIRADNFTCPGCGGSDVDLTDDVPFGVEEEII